MMLILEIALGIVLGVALLNMITGTKAEFFDWLEWKRRQRAFAERLKLAEMFGFRFDTDSVRPPEDQLNDWERERARQDEIEA